MGNCNSAVYEEGEFQAHIDQMNKNLPQVADVNVLSYNIFVRPPMINSNGDDYKDERLNEFLKVAKNYDIICLQEMFGAWSDRKEQLVECAKKIGFPFYAMSEKPPTLSHLLIDGGLLILSRFPIETIDFCPYSYGIGSDFVVQKGALYAKIRIGNAKLHLYTTHAQATYDGTLKYFLKRTEQFNEFQKFIKKTLIENSYTNDDMVLLTGDFNVNGRDSQKFQSSNPELAPVFQKFGNLTKAGAYGEYEALMSCLSNDNEDHVEDLLLSNYKEHPVTFGDYYLTPNNEKRPKESVLTDKSCQCVAESLDYIFKYTPKDLPISPSLKSTAKQSLVVKQNSAVVEKFLIFGHRFEQLSDHYAVQVTLQIKQNRQDNEDADTDSSSPYIQGYPARVAQLE